MAGSREIGKDHSRGGRDESVRLGRVSDWVRLDTGAEVPAGQKLLLMDDEEIPILEVRDLQIDPQATSESGE